MSIKIKYYVRSLPNSKRRDRIGEHFKEMLGDFEYWDNTHYNSEEFKSIVSSGRVEVVDNYIHRLNYYSGTRFQSRGADVLSSCTGSKFLFNDETHEKDCL